MNQLCKTVNKKGLTYSNPRLDGFVIDGKMVKYTLSQRLLPDIHLFRKIKGGKDVFAFEILPQLNASIFTNFAPLFMKLEEILQ